MSDAYTRPDPAAAYEALRTTAAQMLGLDLANELTPTASLQVNLVSVLLLELDGSKVKRWRTRLGTAVALLTKLLPAATEPPPDGRPRGEAKAKLKALIEQTLRSGLPVDRRHRRQPSALSSLRPRSRGGARCWRERRHPLPVHHRPPLLLLHLNGMRQSGKAPMAPPTPAAAACSVSETPIDGPCCHRTGAASCHQQRRRRTRTTNHA
jgi:hypothetical protein